MRRNFPVREKSGNFVKTGKVRNFTQNTGKTRKIYWKIEKKKKKYWKSQGNVSVRNSENPANMYNTLNKNELLKMLENCEKYWKSQVNL